MNKEKNRKKAINKTVKETENAFHLQPHDKVHDIAPKSFEELNYMIGDEKDHYATDSFNDKTNEDHHNISGCSKYIDTTKLAQNKKKDSLMKYNRDENFDSKHTGSETGSGTYRSSLEYRKDSSEKDQKVPIEVKKDVSEVLENILQLNNEGFGSISNRNYVKIKKQRAVNSNEIDRSSGEDNIKIKMNSSNATSKHVHQKNTGAGSKETLESITSVHDMVRSKEPEVTFNYDTKVRTHYNLTNLSSYIKNNFPSVNKFL
jgi:hypothetical protein